MDGTNRGKCKGCVAIARERVYQGGYPIIEMWMSKMTGKGEYVKCPKCGGQARVVWVSQDGKTAAIKCVGYHSHSEIGPPTKGGSYYKPKPEKKSAKGMVFLIEDIGK